MKRLDIAVVGLGAVGGAALLAAARAGAKAIGFDKYAPPHALGSTHGETRIVRAAIGEGTEYSPFALRSFELWDQLETETGERLLTRCGLLVLGGGVPHATHVPEGFFETTIDAARRFSVAHELITSAEVRVRFPAFARFEGERAYFEPGAGMAFPERVVAAQLRRARELGADTRFNMPVTSIAKDGDGVLIRAGTESFRAARAVLAAGAWTTSFLPAGHARHLTVTRQTLHWFAPPPGSAAFGPERMPVFIWNEIYGFPVASLAGGVKVATEALNATTSPDEIRALDKADIDLLVPRVRAAFPQLGAYLRGATCLYTSTPNFRFWVAPHPEIAAVTVVSACSGHGFKHAAALGEAVVGAMISRPTLSIPTAWARMAS